MICPKCQHRMTTVARNGVHIDQCEGCRGIFLDRGELEAMVGAESTFYGHRPHREGHADSPRPYRDSQQPYRDSQQPYRDSPRPYRDSPGPYRDSPRPYRGGHADSPRPYRGGCYPDSPRPHGHRKRSFLENLFD